MFKDPNFFLKLRQKVVPMLKTYPSVRIWAVGCSSCEDIDSIAILLHEEGLAAKCQIYATQESEKILLKVNRGGVVSSNLKQYQNRYKKAGGKGDIREFFLKKGNCSFLKKTLKTNVSIFQHNLKTDSSFNEFQAIFCRGLINHFDPSLGERVHRLLFESLCPFGILGLGPKETIKGSGFEAHYEILEPKISLYKKVR